RGPRPAGPADLSLPDPTPGPSRITSTPPLTSSRDSPTPQYSCPNCERVFTTKTGLGVHRRRAHEAVTNEEIVVERTKRFWSAEELRMMAREEATAVHRGVKFINQHLASVVPGRTLDAIKGARRGPEYKRLVAAVLEDLAASSSGEDSFRSAAGSSPHSLPATPPPNQLSSTTHVATDRREDHAREDFYAAITSLVPVVANIRGWESHSLAEIATDFADGHNVRERVGAWLNRVFPPTTIPWRPRQPYRIANPGKKLRRRIEYANMQRMFRVSMSRAAKWALDGPEDGTMAPDVRVMARHWGPFVAQTSEPVQRTDTTPCGRELPFIWHPVSCEEVAAVNLPLNAAPGLDGISVRLWRAVPSSIKALLFNVVLAVGGFPAATLVSRTIFIPKKEKPTSPGDFRPISIASVVVRHLHKILAERIREAGCVDLRQRCFDDGCAENVAVLASALHDARSRRRELHVAALDFAKAFDSVSHRALVTVLARVGMPRGFTDYVGRLYSESATTFEVRGERSELFSVGRGVRQGDPLSPILFCLVLDRVMAGLPPDVGYDLRGRRIGCTSYADDVLLFAATKWGLQTSLRVVEDTAREMGLQFNTKKSTVLSLVPAGKQKKIKIVTTPTFQLRSGVYLPQLDTTSEWRYLGVDFQPAGPKKVGSNLTTLLSRLTVAPLKPQQRIKILRCFLLPRLYHALVLGQATLGKLRALDVQTRAAVRRWLRLPKDTPTGFFHASTASGGLGIPALTTSIPGLLLGRLGNLSRSAAPDIRAVAESAWVTRRLRWATNVLTHEGAVLSSKYLRKKWWSQKLHTSADGWELRECPKTTLSSWWVDGGSHAIPGRDFVQHVHVRINSLPTLVRTSRGLRRACMSTRCRAGCNVTETSAHVIQGCHRTHGGRILRHNAICRTMASGLRRAGWTVHEEPMYVTAEGTRKPDLVCERGGQVAVVDSQVVSGYGPLDEAHERKAAYYRDNSSLVELLSRGYGVHQSAITFSTCTISWRGVWCAKSADWLLKMGLSKGLLRGITTRVLQGSHTNWTRWNRMTTRGSTERRGEGFERQGVG
ncbi:hypothetical protein KPH14_012788, partial [Odynerus spinipes]